MCGLAGMLSWQAPAEADRVRAMCDALAHRGPDGAGLWTSPDGRTVLGHRRLAIIDLDARANQPLADASGRWTIVFNGEIYNFRSLRADLAREGYVFVTESDTEVILALVARRGPQALVQLRGMYALALWDNAENRLILARDPYGIKPLYLHQNPAGLAFASEVRALARGQPLTPDPAAVVGFFLYGFVPEPHTPWEGIEILPPGAVIEIGPGGKRRRLASQDPFETLRNTAAGTSQAGAQISAAVEDSLDAHMVADVPVALFLSSGIDSTAILGGLSGLGRRDIHCFSLGFEEFQGTADDEVPLARAVAEHYGAKSIVAYVSRDQFNASVDRFLTDMDQPTIDGLNTWFVCRAAHEAGLKVALSGLGGDELFGGYSSFRRIPRYRASLARLARFGIGPWAGRLASRLAPNHKALRLLAAGPETAAVYAVLRGLLGAGGLQGLLDRDLLQAGLQRLNVLTDLSDMLQGVDTEFSRISVLESRFYMRNQLLRDSDWASMAHSLELRVPLVDTQLTAAVAPLLGDHAQDRPKAALAAVPRQPLPREVTERRKTGFSTPMTEWLRASPRLAGAGAENTPWTHRWARHVAETYWGADIFGKR